MDEQDQDKVWSDTVRPETAVPHQHQQLSQRTAARMHLGVIVALALAGLVLVWIIGVTIVQWRAQVAAQETLRVTQEAQRQAQAQIEQMQREALARQAQLEAEQHLQEVKRIEALTEQQRAADAARRAEADIADRREKAWARFYRPPPHCETAATMDCTNRYIRARRVFDEKFAKGEL